RGCGEIVGRLRPDFKYITSRNGAGYRPRLVKLRGQCFQLRRALSNLPSYPPDTLLGLLIGNNVSKQRTFEIQAIQVISDIVRVLSDEARDPRPRKFGN